MADNDITLTYFPGVNVVPVVLPITTTTLASCYETSWNTYLDCWYSCSQVPGSPRTTCLDGCDNDYGSDIAACVV